MFEEDTILNRYSYLTAAEVSQKEAEKEMNDFIKQLEANNTASALLTSNIIKSNKFKIVIFSNKEKNNKNNSKNN